MMPVSVTYNMGINVRILGISFYIELHVEGMHNSECKPMHNSEKYTCIKTALGKGLLT